MEALSPMMVMASYGQIPRAHLPQPMHSPFTFTAMVADPWSPLVEAWSFSLVIVWLLSVVEAWSLPLVEVLWSETADVLCSLLEHDMKVPAR
jgi:hypothetical protein